MEKSKIIRETVRKFLNENKNYNNKSKKFINEIYQSNKTIVNVDIQPEYKNSIPFLKKWVNFINNSSSENTIVFLYNGAETLGMIDLYSYQEWLIDYGISEDVIQNSIFFDKGYAFFRYCMDNSIDEDNIVDLVKFMLKHNINDSRDIDENMWNNYMVEMNRTQDDVRDLLEEADDLISIPDLMDFLSNYNNVVLCGGGISECLKEVEIALLCLDKNYSILSEFVY